MNGITFDAGGLTALDQNDRRVIALLARATELGMRVTVPGSALAQALRNPAGQARLSRLIRQGTTDPAPLHGPDATAVGLLLAETATADIVDAHVKRFALGGRGRLLLRAILETSGESIRNCG